MIGELAALTTALCWAFTSIFFTLGGMRVGSVVVNRVRLLIAVVFLSISHLVYTGQLIPIDAEPRRWFWLGISGLIGLVIGDAMLFQAFVVIGPRLSILLMSFVPVISAFLAYILLGEILSLVELAAIAVVIGGISWVVLERDINNNRHKQLTTKQFSIGILLGFGGAFGQAGGLLASKVGLEGGFSALSGNLIRMIVAASIMWILTIAVGEAKRTISRLKDTKAFTAIIGGSFFGPFVGVWMSLIAIVHTKIGIASTLMTLTPILVIPLSHYVFKERISVRAVLGTIVAVAGVALLMMN
ncbi:MAG: EamA family transporter [candidate division Zixibacteria bacterium]|nr:EamA family transporter [candidate division Zixibacteria bacterium]